MAYGGYYPATYQNQYYQNYQGFQQPMQQQYQPQQVAQAQPQPQQQNQQVSSNGINWVQGEAGARSWLVAPNTTVFLMDSESDTFYLKSADGSGMPLPLRIFDYTERRSEASKNDLAEVKGKSIEYATKDDLNALQSSTRDDIAELRKQLKDEISDMFSGGSISFTTKASKKKEAIVNE